MKDYKSCLKTVQGNEGSKCNYPTRLDTYSSCSHDCDYCYSKSLLYFRGMWNPEHPSVSLMSDISKAIRKLPCGEVVRLGGMTDCFQPLEKLHRITYKTISLLNRRKIPYLIVTKSALVGEPEYIKLMDRDLAHIQVTVTTLDDEKCTYEKASKPSARLKAIKTLQNEGFDVQLRLSPFIPNYVNISDLNGLKIDKILVEFLRANSWIQKWFKTDYSEYTISQSGYKHLPLEKKLKYIKDIDFKEMTVCEDESVAYEYWKNHYNHNPNDCCNLRKG